MHADVLTSLAGQCPRRRGMTLIEVLVTFSIIVLLLATALHYFSGAREQAQRTGCLNNLRSMGQALRMYMDTENRGFLPAVPSYWATRSELRPQFHRIFTEVLREYVDAPPPRLDRAGNVLTASPWRCPGDPYLAEQIGFSYEYAMGRVIEDHITWRISRPRAEAMTLYFDQYPSRPSGPRFRGRGTIVDIHHIMHHRIAPSGYFGMNAVFFDGSAGWWYFPITAGYIPDLPIYEPPWDWTE